MTNTNLVFGITGMPGSGKSAMTKFFCAQYGVCIDTDKIGHEVLCEPIIRDRLVNTFGPEISLDGMIDRNALSKLAFNRVDITKLNSICHPRIKEIVKDKLKKPLPLGSFYVVEVPLLFEAGFDDLCTDTFCLDVHYKTRLKRVREQRNWDENELRKRDACQNESLKKEATDILINGEASLKEIKNEIDRFIIAVRYSSALWVKKNIKISYLKEIDELFSEELNLLTLRENADRK
jgi:dephospho-CoA kinase